jgi:hypothetical protein
MQQTGHEKPCALGVDKALAVVFDFDDVHE